MPKDTSVENLDRAETIAALSHAHKAHSTDPETLCRAAKCEFDLPTDDIMRVLKLRDRLFTLCFDAGEPWTRK